MDRMVLNIIIAVLLFYTTAVAILFFSQRGMIFVPDISPAFTEQSDEIMAQIKSGKVVSYETSDGLTLKGWYRGKGPEDRLTIVIFHGNAGHVSDRIYRADHFSPAHYGVFIVGYRGYGGNPGSPSAEGFYKDARAALTTLHTKKGVPYEKMVLYGISLGSGVATKMAQEFDIRAVILEAAYTSIANRAREIYPLLPVKTLLRDRFNNIDRVSAINKPILFLHGDKDTTIPIEHAHKLFNKAHEPKSLVIIPDGEHTGLYDLGAHKPVLDFLYQLFLKDINSNDQ